MLPSDMTYKKNTRTHIHLVSQWSIKALKYSHPCYWLPLTSLCKQEHTDTHAMHTLCNQASFRIPGETWFTKSLTAVTWINLNQMYSEAAHLPMFISYNISERFFLCVCGPGAVNVLLSWYTISFADDAQQVSVRTSRAAFHQAQTQTGCFVRARLTVLLASSSVADSTLRS